MVVDNAPDGRDTQTMIVERYPVVRYIFEPTPGLNFARNRALEESRQDIIAFMDDDAIADPNWIRRIVEVFSANQSVAVCTGRVKPFRLETEAQRLFEAQGGFDRGTVRIRMPQDASLRKMHGFKVPLIAWSIAIGVGASLAVRKTALATIGNFDTALDLGAALPGGGDVDFIWRTLDSGLDVIYEPEAIVMHEHRRQIEEVQAQIIGHRRAEIAFLTKSVRNARGLKRASILAFLCWRLVKPGLRLLRRLAYRGDPLPAILILRLWAASWRGLTSYHQAAQLAHERAVGKAV